MAVLVVKGGNPSFADGALNSGGGEEFTRVQALDVFLKQTREMTGTQPHALVIVVVRDAAQGTAADLLAHKTKYGAKGRAQKSVFPLVVMLVDDVRNGMAALVGTIKCGKAVIHSLKAIGGMQVITFHASEWVYKNAISGRDEPADESLVPVVTEGFDEPLDAAKVAGAAE